jgi:hypothetical protein
MTVLHRRRDGERTEFLGRREFRDETLGINVEFDPPGPRSEIQVETSLESLLHHVLVAWYQPQCVVLVRQEIGLAILLVLLLPLAPLLLGGHVLLGRVVRLDRLRRRELGRGHVHGMFRVWLVRLWPDGVHRGFGRGGFVGEDTTFSDGLDDLDDLEKTSAAT